MKAVNYATNDLNLARTVLIFEFNMQLRFSSQTGKNVCNYVFMKKLSIFKHGEVQFIRL